MYKVDPSAEAISEVFRSIAFDQIDEALSGAEPGAHSRTTVHEARRRCKKLRALLRLVRPGFDAFDRENAAIRDASAILSHLRDAEVMRHTLDDLAATTQEAVVADIATRFVASEPDDGAALLAGFAAALRDVRGRVASWTLEPDNRDTVLRGFRATYRQARRRMRKARKAGAASDWHDWRKATKNHGFHLDLLRRLAPDVLAGQADATDRLGALLGTMQDLAVLDGAAAKDPGRFGSFDEVAALRGAIATQHDALAEKAGALGDQVFAEAPRAFTRRVRRYWTAVA